MFVFHKQKRKHRLKKQRYLRGRKNRFSIKFNILFLSVVKNIYKQCLPSHFILTNVKTNSFHTHICDYFMPFTLSLLLVFNIESRVIKTKTIEHHKNKSSTSFFNNFIVLWDHKVFLRSKASFQPAIEYHRPTLAIMNKSLSIQHHFWSLISLSNIINADNIIIIRFDSLPCRSKTFHLLFY